jgi:DNA-binding NarL/FixJ family response regulator
MNKNPSSHKIKVSLIEDIPYVRNHLKNDLSESKGISVIHALANGFEAIEAIKNNVPEIILTDLFMPGMDGIELIDVINKTHPEIKIIVLSAYLTPMITIKLIEKGVCAIFDKDFKLPEVVKGIFEVHKNGYYFNEYFSKAMFDHIKDPDKKGHLMPDNIILTDDDIKMMKMICLGWQNLPMADKLFLTIKTLGRDKKALLIKTNCKTDAELIFYAIRNKIVSIHEQIIID